MRIVANSAAKINMYATHRDVTDANYGCSYSRWRVAFFLGFAVMFFVICLADDVVAGDVESGCIFSSCHASVEMPRPSLSLGG